MKRYISLFCLVASLFSMLFVSCEKEPMTYEGKDTIYFDIRRGAEWMVRWFSKPYNEFMKQPEQHYNNGTTVGYNYFDRTFYARPLIEDVQQIRASLLFAFPEKEFRNNGGISESDQNDFYWYTVTPTIPATLDEAGLQ